MNQRGYQHHFSSLYPTALADHEQRRRKGRTILAVLSDHLGSPEALRPMRLLDVGAGNGVMDHFLSEFVGCVTGIDIDAASIAQAQGLQARTNLSFRVGDALQTAEPSSSVDLVVCAHVYEHVSNADALFGEIHRVLKPGGLCYLAAGNRFQLMEPHYRLPLLSVIPKAAAHLYLKMLGRGQHYYESHRSYRGLRQLVRDFRLHDYTRRLIEDPERFGVDYLLPAGSTKRRVARTIAQLAYGLVPTYIWLLEKPASESKNR